MSILRRDFIAGATSSMVAGVCAGVVATKCNPVAANKLQDRFRVGIIGRTGKGDYGHGVDVAFTKLPNVEVVALADENETGRAAAVKRTNAQRSYADYHEMLAHEKLDIVAICPRWIDQHASMIEAAAKAGCHVYMEKPFCPTLAECDSAIASLESKNLKLGIAHISQYSPVLRVVKSILESGEIGDLLELRSRGKEDRRGGGEDLWVLGSHIFGLMRTLAGGSPQNCNAVVRSNGRASTKADVTEGAEGIGLLTGDQVQARYEFADGVFGHFGSRKAMGGNPSRFAIQVFGSQGVIEMESGYLAKAYILKDASWSPGRSGKSWLPITSAGIDKPENRVDGTYEGGHIAAILDLMDCIRNDRQPICSAMDARAIIEMIAAVFESHRLGATVKLPLQTRANPLSLIS